MTLNIINACYLAKLVFELPEHLLLVNDLLGHIKKLELELTEDIDQFNSVFWPSLFSLYDAKILNKDVAIDDEQSIAFVIHNDKLGIAFGNMFFSI
ncbi:hypothetical protein [Serratia grimesii]|uniref:hypothetical protein n=1 Tax=Serratia grimesii TaxID=82995 RepID=UPI0039AF5F40